MSTEETLMCDRETFTEQNVESVHTASTNFRADCAAAVILKTNRRMDLIVRWSSCYVVIMSSFGYVQQGSVSELPYMVPLCAFFPLSPFSVSPPCFESKPITLLCTPRHTLSDTHTHREDGLKCGKESSHIRSVFSSGAPCCSNCLSTFQRSSCFLLFSLPCPLTKI